MSVYKFTHQHNTNETNISSVTVKINVIGSNTIQRAVEHRRHITDQNHYVKSEKEE